MVEVEVEVEIEAEVTQVNGGRTEYNNNKIPYRCAEFEEGGPGGVVPRCHHIS